MSTQENREIFTTPVGRWVSGSITQGRDKDDRGQEYKYKTGKNIGQNYLKFSFGIAIPKGAEVSQQYGSNNWMTTEWGQKLTKVGLAFRGDAMQRQEFSWKVKDGDDATLNEKGRANKDNDGWPGHWIVFVTCNCTAPATVACPLYTLIDPATNQHMRQPLSLSDPSKIKRGDYVQVNVTVEPNGEVQKPGVFLNANMVCLIGYGQAIVGGPDVESAGFGQGVALPAGASLVPVGLPASPPTAAPAVPASPPVPPIASTSAPPVTPAAPVPVTPNPAFLQPPPQVPSVPAAPPARQMTEKAQGASYEQLVANGWTDALLIQHGMMLA